MDAIDEFLLGRHRRLSLHGLCGSVSCPAGGGACEMIIHHRLVRPARAVSGNVQGLRRSPRSASMKIYPLAQCRPATRSPPLQKPLHRCHAGLTGYLAANISRHSRQWGASGGCERRQAWQCKEVGAIPPRMSGNSLTYAHSQGSNRPIRRSENAAPCADRWNGSSLWEIGVVPKQTK